MRTMVKLAPGRAGVMAVVLLALVAFAPQAEAIVGNGGTISYIGSGNVTVTFLSSDANFRSYLVLYKASDLATVLTPAGTPCVGCPTGGIFNSDTTPGGTTFVLTEAFLQANFAAGAEMVFAILVDEDINGVIDRIYYMGAAGRNPDAIIHNDSQPGLPQEAIVGFEDFFGGGDFDYNDHIFSFFPVSICDPICAPPPPGGNNSEQPGSVIVFPKFIRGTVAGALPASEFEISAVCPQGVTCTPNQAVRIKAEWVCPGSGVRNVCKETDFILNTTVNGTVVFNPNGGLLPIPPRAPCANGFLIAWVVDASGNPIRFDGLIGDAVLRNGGNSAGAYNGISIQAVADTGPITDEAVAVTGAITDPLTFDGAAGHYQQISSVAISSLRYDTLSGAAAGCGKTGQVSNVCTYLTMLTLDIFSNKANDSTFVDYVFYNAAEQGISTSTEFFCWAELELTTDIDSNLETGTLGRKGLMRAQAGDQLFNDRTMLMIVETLEYGATGTAPDREYSYSTFHDSTVVRSTRFRP